MAANSRRERIILAQKVILEGLSSINHVQRKQPSSLSELEQYPITQMPLLALVTGLPSPQNKTRGRKPGGPDFFHSELVSKVYCYGQDKITPDTTISSLLDDIWSALHSNQTLGLKFVTSCIISPGVETGIWDPYYSFVVECKYMYYHTTGGI
jgi:hypothetical protein